MSLRLTKRKGSPNYHIKGTLFGKTVRQSTGTPGKEKADRILRTVAEEIEHQHLYGGYTMVDFNTAAARFVDESYKSSIETDIIHIKKLSSFIGEMPLQLIRRRCKGIERFIQDEKARGMKNRTINAALQVVRHILNLAASEWDDERGNPWLESAPQFSMLPLTDSRQPYPISWSEQILLFNELPDHLRNMALFKVNTGCREAEVCGLKWEWLHNHREIHFFEIPRENVKNRLHVIVDRVVILNKIALSVINKMRGVNPDYVFTFKGNPLLKMNGSAWKSARIRTGLQKIRVHDLKHTLGARLRAAGVPEEDRKFLLGHKSGMSMTTHYSAPELKLMQEYLNRVCKQDNNLVLLGRRTG
jgi:integrase